MKTKKSKEVIVLADWKHTEEVSPAFKRLMALLLENKGKGSYGERRNEGYICSGGF